MKSLKFIILSGTLSLFSVAYAQTNNTNADVNNDNIANNTVTLQAFDNRYQGIVGSPFVNQRWYKANILPLKAKPLQNILTKYDSCNNILLIKTDKNDSSMISPSVIKEVYFIENEQHFVKSPLLEKENAGSKDRLYEKIYQSDKLTVLKDYGKYMIKADHDRLYGGERNYDEIKEKTEYIIIKKDNSVTRIKKLNNKEVLKVFSEQEDVLKGYIKEKSLDMKKMTDFIALLEYYEKI